MRITSVEFIKSAIKESEYPKAYYPEVAFAGRSNVGKSSLINVVVNRKNLARTSSTPGRTKTINFFLVNHRIYFVDLPGYGFARVPVRFRVQWKPMVENYLIHRATLRLLVIIMDIRRAPHPDDGLLMRWCEGHHIPFFVVLTKVDKLSRSKCLAQRKVTREFFKLDDEELIFFSAITGEGREEVWRRINRAVGEN